MIQGMIMWSPMAIMMWHMSGRTCHPTWTADMAESLNLPTVLIPTVNTTHYLIHKAPTFLGSGSTNPDFIILTY